LRSQNPLELFYFEKKKKKKKKNTDSSEPMPLGPLAKGVAARLFPIEDIVCGADVVVDATAADALRAHLGLERLLEYGATTVRPLIGDNARQRRKRNGIIVKVCEEADQKTKKFIYFSFLVLLVLNTYCLSGLA
jgi:hypothetical protein